jgi:glycosyltransferase involved in cell wall biosynthesis
VISRRRARDQSPPTAGEQARAARGSGGRAPGEQARAARGSGGRAPGEQARAARGSGGRPQGEQGLPAGRGLSPRLATLAASVAWRHLADDPVRALILAWRVLPSGPRRLVRLAGPYGRAVTAWGSGDRDGALRAVASAPRRQARFALAVDMPEPAALALARLAPGDRARPVLTARLAWREGRLTDMAAALDGAPGRQARVLRATLRAERRAASRGWPPVRPIRRKPIVPRVPGRVLHIVTNALPNTSAGYTVRTHQIAVAQRAAGMDPHVMTECGFPVAQGHLDTRRAVDLDGVPYHRLLPLSLPRRRDAAMARGADLAAGLVERLNPAVLHAASNHVNGQLALALRDVFGLPVVYEVRGFLEDSWLSRHSGDLSGSDVYRLSRDLETHCMRGADLVVTLGEAMREEIIARGIRAERVLVVPNAVSSEFLSPLPDGRALRASLGIGPDEPVAGLVSSLFAHEGVPTFLEAAALLHQRGLPVRPLIVGDGPERASLEHLAARLGLGGKAVFTGRVPVRDVRRYHAVLDVFVIPRTADRVCQLVTPLKPVEAMASGLCVVASDVRALREVIKHGSTGTLTLPQDPAALADCLEMLLYSPDVRRELGAKAREWVAGDRTWARNAQRYRLAYESLGAG